MNDYFKPHCNPWHYKLKDYKEFCCWKWTLENWFYHNPRYLFKWVKWFFQRGSRGWADCDWWNMNSYLIKVTIPMLKKLKEGHSYPYVEGAKDENEWCERLDEMIEAFEAAQRVIEDEYTIDDVNWWEAFSNPTPKLKEDVSIAIQKSIKMSKADQKIFEKKIKVFVKWFYQLWD